MLRRDFLRTAALSAGGLLLVGNAADTLAGWDEKMPPERRPTIYQFHGHPRSGCATRPELAPFLRDGIAQMPPF